MRIFTRSRFRRCLLTAVLSIVVPVVQAAMVIPLGTPIFGVLDEQVTSGGKVRKSDWKEGEPRKLPPSKVGDIVRAHVWKNVVVNGVTVIKANAPILAEVSFVQKPKIAGRQGKVFVKAVSVTAGDGSQVPLTGGYDQLGHKKVVSTALLAGLLFLPLIFMRGRAAVLRPGTKFDAETVAQQEVRLDDETPIAKVKLESPLNVEILYDELAKEEKPKSLPVSIEICGDALNAAEVVKVNDQEIDSIGVELTEAVESEDCSSAEGRVSLKALGKHYWWLRAKLEEVVPGSDTYFKVCLTRFPVDEPLQHRGAVDYIRRH